MVRCDTVQLLLRAACAQSLEIQQDVRLFLGALNVEVQGLEGGDLRRARLRMNRLGEEPSVDVRPGSGQRIEGIPSGIWEYRFSLSGREDVTGSVEVQGESSALTLQPGTPKKDGG